jgi:hypothetical protein
MTAARIANDLLRFALELLALAVLFSWGAHTVGGAGRWAVGLGAVLAGAAFWGWFLAPKSAHRLDDPIRLGVELAFFAGITLAIATLRSPVTAAAFLAVATANALVMRIDEVAGRAWP